MLRRIFVFLFLLCVVARVRAVQTPSTPLRDYAMRAKGRQAYGLYFQGRKAGWMIDELKLEARGAGASKKEVAVSRIEMTIAMGRATDRTTLHSTQVSYYDLRGDGALIFASQQILDDGKTTTYIARPQTGNNSAGKILVSTQKNGRIVARRATSTLDTLGMAQRFQAWLQSKPQAGAKFQFPVMDLPSARDVSSDYVFQNAQTISWGGVPTEIFSVRSTSQGMASDAQIKSNGWPIKERIAGVFELRAEDEVIAKKLSSHLIDLLAASMIRADKDLGNPRNANELKLEISGVKDFSFPTSPRQKVLSHKAQTVVLETRRDFQTLIAAPLSASQKTEYLRATQTYSQTPAIKNLARKIIGGERKPLKKAALLKSWVYENLRKSMSANAETASQVLAQRAGDCTEHTILFVALARACGIPAREAGGIMYAGDARNSFFAWHAWAQFHDGHQWVSIDPTWDEIFVDATHIQLSSGEDDWAWMNVLGTLKIKVLAETKTE